jgi:predicted ATPase/class 3 adenylate cyclase
VNPVSAIAFPSGTVTLVFTDIQGSTVLWERLGDSFVGVLEAHNRILREALGRFGGAEVKTEGDAFMVAFASAADAVRFALAAQEALHVVPWPAAAGELLVRMGLHTGDPICVADPATGRMDYFGPVVNRAARVADAAHGGQVLLTEATRAAGGDALAGAAVTDLGTHRLRGLERPERLFQALPPPLADRHFAPLRTLTARPTNLPAPTTSFIGRERELRALSDLLAEEAVRLVTLTGPGGTGKTRLALRLGHELLDRHEGGVWFADLTGATTAAGVANAVAQAFGVPLAGQGPPERAVADLLEYRRPLLLILDNFEQVVEHAPATVGLWRERAPHVRFLVTSRSLLGLAGEREVPVAPLSAPARGTLRLTRAKLVEAFDGIKLFLDRAREARPGFALDDTNATAVAQICADLEGIPLAIELAAARIRILTPEEIRAKLAQRFQLLRSSRRDLAPRQQTLLGALSWSYDLLADWEREVFLQACAFRGGFFLDAAEAVIDLAAFPDAPQAMDAVQRLREKSLLKTAETAYGTRYGLYVSIREFGEQKGREAGRGAAAPAVDRRLAAHYIAAAEAWDARLHTAGGLEALDRLELETENLFAVQERALGAGDAETAAPAVLALAELMAVRGPADQRVPRLEASLEALRGAAGPLPVRLRTALSAACQTVGDSARALDLAGEAVDGARPSGRTLPLAEALGQLGAVRFGRGDLVGAQACFAEGEAVARELGGRVVVVRILGYRGNLLTSQGDFAGALACYGEAEALARELGDRLAIASNVGNRGIVLVDRGDLDGGLRSYDEGLAIGRELGNRSVVARHLCNRGSVLTRRGDLDAALACYAEAESIARELGDRLLVASTVGNRGIVLRRRGEPAEAIRCLEETEAIGRAMGHKRVLAVCLENRGAALLALGRAAEAHRAVRGALDLHREMRSERSPEYFNAVATLAAAEGALGNRDEAARLAAEALALAERLGYDDRHPDPLVRDTLAGVRRLQGGA